MSSASERDEEIDRAVDAYREALEAEAIAARIAAAANQKHDNAKALAYRTQHSLHSLIKSKHES